MIIFADDLTGAMDAGAPFAARGLRVELWLDASYFDREEAAAAADVTVVNLECRHLAPEAASQKIAEAKQRLGADRIHFLKIDSTLRGPLPAMIEAVARPNSAIVFCPAVPAQRRVVRGGQVLVDGVALAESSCANDPRTRPFLQNLLAALFPLQISMPDAASASDLESIVRQSPADTVFIGAAGLTEALAAVRFGPRLAKKPQAPGRRALFVLGSPDPATRRQRQVLRERFPNFIVLDTPEAISDPLMIANDLARKAASFIERARPDIAVLSGGDTASSVLALLRCRRLTVIGELGNGLNAGRTFHRGGEFTVITKAGGFGEDDALAALIKELRLVPCA